MADGMSRRAVLRAFLAAAPAMLLDPERLLWVPGERTIFVPPVAGWASMTDRTTGIAVRFVRHFEANRDPFLLRFDMLIAMPELRITA